eukprot:TRINITY_DN5474_c0_g2_i17.p3 TRINITY_DN5474_c0_g2~~TRINITY_DN5474_c0_g2_i17.p3  ORF type:complete len:103 (+),score=10.40 TRINITY_DN5474_c0_g2_i17:675-983(+)
MKGLKFKQTKDFFVKQQSRAAIGRNGGWGIIFSIKKKKQFSKYQCVKCIRNCISSASVCDKNECKFQCIKRDISVLDQNEWKFQCIFNKTFQQNVSVFDNKE